MFILSFQCLKTSFQSFFKIVSNKLSKLLHQSLFRKKIFYTTQQKISMPYIDTDTQFTFVCGVLLFYKSIQRGGLKRLDICRGHKESSRTISLQMSRKTSYMYSLFIIIASNTEDKWISAPKNAGAVTGGIYRIGKKCCKYDLLEEINHKDHELRSPIERKTRKFRKENDIYEESFTKKLSISQFKTVYFYKIWSSNCANKRTLITFVIYSTFREWHTYFLPHIYQCMYV